MAAIARRRSVPVSIGNVKVGGSNPIVVQSMTNTDTADVMSTVNQVMALANAGSELVRITVNTPAAAAAVPRIRERLEMMGVNVPIIGDCAHVIEEDRAKVGFKSGRNETPHVLVAAKSMSEDHGPVSAPPDVDAVAQENWHALNSEKIESAPTNKTSPTI